MIDNSFLIYTALDENGDITVLDKNGNNLPYSEYKSNISKLPLNFPHNNIAREIKDLQIYLFEKTIEHFVIIRSKISGKSIVEDISRGRIFRPVPIFEIFQIKKESLIKETNSENEFLSMIRELEFMNYPKEPENINEPGIFKPKRWYVPERLEYGSTINKKAKSSYRYSDVQNWNNEYKKSIDKLLWFFYKRRKTNGISICFSKNDFNKFDVCNYYYEHYYEQFNWSILKYNLLKPE